MSENNFFNPAQFGSIPMPSMPTAGAFNNVPANATNNAAFAQSRGAEITLIGYVAAKYNTIREANLNTIEAKRVWNNLKASFNGTRPDDWNEIIEYTDKTGKTRSVKFELNYKESVFKAYMSKYKPADYEEVLKTKAYKIDMSEAKIDRYVLKLDTNSSAINDLARFAGSTTSTIKGIAVLTSAELVEFFSAANLATIPIVVTKKDSEGKPILSAGAEETIEVGTLYLALTEVKAKKDGVSVTKKTIVTRIKDRNDKKSAIRELGLIAGSNDENSKVPYAVLTRYTTNSPYGDINPGSILNLERFRTLFPAQDPTQLPARLKLQKKEFNGDEKQFREAKIAQYLSHEESGAVALGIDEATWSALTSPRSSKGGKKVTLADAQDSTVKALEAFRTQGVKAAGSR